MPADRSHAPAPPTGSHGAADAHRPVVLVSWTLGANALLFVAAVAVFAASRSQLVLAQGADSLIDLVGGAILWVTARVGRRPRDEDHPFGHARAAPIGALFTAVFAGVLMIEILESAIGALWTGRSVPLDAWVAGILGAKLLLKALLLRALGPTAGRIPDATLAALRTDTRNDLAACASSLVGFALSRAGWLWMDAALALPIAVYIGWNGLELLRENLGYLMGEAPPQDVQDELLELARGVRGVRRVGRLRAVFAGTELHVEVAIEVADARSVTEGHDIGVEVQDRLEGHPLVAEAFVHVDSASGRDHGEEPVGLPAAQRSPDQNT